MIKENDVIGVIVALYVAVGVLLAICYCRYRPTVIGLGIEGGSCRDSKDRSFSSLSLSSPAFDSGPEPPTNPPAGPWTTRDPISVPPATDRDSGLKFPKEPGISRDRIRVPPTTDRDSGLKAPTGSGINRGRIRVPPNTDRKGGLRVPWDAGKGGGSAVKGDRGREGGLRVPPDAGIAGGPGVPRFVGRGSGIRVPKSPGTSG